VVVVVADLLDVELVYSGDDLLQSGRRQGARLGEDQRTALKAIKVGIDVICAAAARDCSASVSTLPKTTSRWCSDACS